MLNWLLIEIILKENLERCDLKANIIQSDAFDITGKFDFVLLDAPCSALGTFRRNPDVTVKIDKPIIKKQQKTQIQMIEKSLKMVQKS